MRKWLSFGRVKTAGDITTLANPDVVEQIRVQVQGKEKVAQKEGPEDIKQFGSVE